MRFKVTPPTPPTPLQLELDLFPASPGEVIVADSASILRIPVLPVGVL